MQQNTIHFWTHLVVLCPLEQEGGAAVLCGQTLSSKSGILWIYGDSWQLGTARRRKRLNHDYVSDLQVVALQRCPSSWLTIPSWMTVQNVPSCLELTNVRFCSLELSCFERSTNHASWTAWPMLNVYHFKLGKETLNLGTTQPLHWIAG